MASNYYWVRKGHEEVADKWHLFNPLLKEMRKDGPDTDAPRRQLGQEGDPPRLRKSPGFTMCSVQH